MTMDHMNHLHMIIQYSYEKLIPSERFCGHIHFEFDKCIACEVCVYVCSINLHIVDWKLRNNKRKKKLSYNIDFEVCIFCGNYVKYFPTNFY
jgi:NAD(P)H-quinone oxidoreductase subunit I